MPNQISADPDPRPDPAMPAQLTYGWSNILAHPGSTWAGVGLALITIGTAINAQGLPSSAGGWVAFAMSLAVSLMAALSK